MLQATFPALERYSVTPGEEKVVDISDICKDPIVARNFQEYAQGASIVTCKSKVNPGTTVIAALRGTQTKRVPLSASDVTNCWKIYESIPALHDSHKSTIGSLFSNSFSIRLIKTVGKDNKPRNDAPGKKNELGTGGTVGKKRSKDKREKLAAFHMRRLGSLIDDVKLDNITEDLLDKYWMPALVKMERYRLIVGICPVYFLTVEEITHTYGHDTVEKPVRSSGTSSGSGSGSGSGSDGEFEGSEESQSERNPTPFNAKGDKPRSFKKPPKQKKTPSHEDSALAPAIEEDFSFVNELYDAGEGKVLELLTAKDPKRVAKQLSKETKDGQELLMGGAGPLGRLAKSGEVFGGRKPQELMGDPQSGFPSDANAEGYGLTLNSDGIIQGTEGKIRQLAEENREDQNKPAGASKVQLPSDARLLLGALTPEEAEKKRVKEGVSLQREIRLKEAAARTDEKLEEVKNTKKGRKKGSGSFVRVAGTLEKAKQTEPANRKRKRIYGAGGRKAPKIRKIETRTIHQVPCVPDFKQGHVETDQDVGPPRYYWIWDTDDEYKGNLEPFMYWVRFDEHPGPDGRLKSGVSTMLDDYEEYLQAKKDYETAVKQAENPFYVVEKVEKDVTKTGPTGALSADNFTPMFGNLQTNGYYRPEEATLNLDDAALEDALRASALGKGGPGIPMVPRGFLAQYGPNRPPHWDAGGLTTLDSPEYALYGRGAAAASLMNRYDGMGLPTAGRGMGEDEGFSAKVGHEQGYYAYYQKSVGIRRKSVNPEHDADCAKKEFQANAAAAKSAAVLTGRYTAFTPQGTIMFLEPNEVLRKVESGHHATGTGLQRMDELGRRLNRTGSLIGGSPNSIMNEISKKGAGPDGVFTSKSTGASNSYGLSISTVAQSPTKEYAAGKLGELQALYCKILKDMFLTAYKDAFKREEGWYRNILKQVFAEELESFDRKNSKRARNGKPVKNYTTSEMPKLETLFDVKVIFPMQKSDGNLPLALDGYKLGMLKPEEVLMVMSAQFPHIMSGERKFSMMVNQNVDENETFEERLKSTIAGLDAAVNFEKEVALKPTATKPSTTKTTKKK